MERRPDPDEIISRLGELYRDDPEAFEAMRKLLIEQTIEGFPAEHRARAYGMQFRIDAELSLCKDPISRMNRMVEIFWDGVRQFESAVTDPERFAETRKMRRHPGTVIPFPGNKGESVH